MSVEVRHGHAPLPPEADDGPAVAVADRFVPVGAQRPVVTPGDDDFADGRGLASCDTGSALAEVADRSALLLDGAV